FDDLERALFDRIGEHFSLGYVLARPYTWGRGANDAASEEAAWLAKLREAWRGRGRLWIGRALVTWPYALGVVELAMRREGVESLRLTPLGRSLLRPEAGTPAEEPPPEASPPWIV